MAEESKNPTPKSPAPKHPHLEKVGKTFLELLAAAANEVNNLKDAEKPAEALRNLPPRPGGHMKFRYLISSTYSGDTTGTNDKTTVSAISASAASATTKYSAKSNRNRTHRLEPVQLRGAS